MGEIDRPQWCPDETCSPLISFASRLCWGRLRRQEKHDDLMNTHSECRDDDDRIMVNYEDAYYQKRGSEAIMKDCLDNKLYIPPGRNETYEIKVD